MRSNVSTIGSSAAGDCIVENFFIAGGLDAGHSSAAGVSAILTGSMLIICPSAAVFDVYVASDVSPIVGGGNDVAGNYESFSSLALEIFGSFSRVLFTRSLFRPFQACLVDYSLVVSLLLVKDVIDLPLGGGRF